MSEERWEGYPEGQLLAEHRTAGRRAWSMPSSEWCSRNAPCQSCELGTLRAEVERLREALTFVSAYAEETAHNDHDGAIEDCQFDPCKSLIAARFAALTPQEEAEGFDLRRVADLPEFAESRQKAEHAREESRTESADEVLKRIGRQVD